MPHSLAGVGPRIGKRVLPLIMLVVAQLFLAPGLARMGCSPHAGRVLGFVLLGVWLLVYVPTGVLLVRGIKAGRLVTGGPFAWSRHPLYASFIYLFIPAMACLSRSWLVLALAPVVYLVARREVRDEDATLANLFGDDYATYRERTHAFLLLPHPRGWFGRGVVALVAAALVFAFLYLTGIRPWFLRWGATDAEVAAVLPGDTLVSPARFVSTRAVTVHAAPDRIDPWLRQMGQTKAGLYSYTWLENLFGCQMPEVHRIEPAFQGTKAGDVFRLDPRVPPLQVAMVQPNSAFVISAGSPPVVSWAFVLRYQDDHTTRLVVRWRSTYPPGFGNALVNRYLIEPIHFVMERKMMLTIKALAERR
jgi:protein-S-isoprenylcysteine O-methyltransferase Ste14